MWPAVCRVCSSPVPETSQGLCRKCWDHLLFCSSGDYCPRCGKDASKYGLLDGACANCQDRQIHYDGIARGGVYDRVLREMILAFKFHDRMELTSLIGTMTDSAFQGSGFAQKIDYFVPVPLHWLRRFGRGYNQAHIICKKLDHPSAKINTDLVRMRNTQRQWSLSPSKRKRNVKGAFAVRDGHDYSRRNICLVDDITTSGATLNECAKTLKQAGAEKVYALVTAVAMQDAT